MSSSNVSHESPYPSPASSKSTIHSSKPRLSSNLTETKSRSRLKLILVGGSHLWKKTFASEGRSRSRSKKKERKLNFVQPVQSAPEAPKHSGGSNIDKKKFDFIAWIRKYRREHYIRGYPGYPEGVWPYDAKKFRRLGDMFKL